MIELECLGPLAVTVDGAEPPAELLWRKNLAVLVYLARSPRGRTRDHLVGLFWPEKDEAKARHSLNEALRVLRRTVGNALTTEADTVRLDRSAVRVDADDLSSASIRGVFLEGFTVPDAPAFEDWLVSERERLRALVLDHLVAEAGDAVARGALAAAREFAQQALEVEPGHEPAARALMRTYALGGSRVLALRAYERLVSLMARDLDLAPGEETRLLADRIRSGRIMRGAPAGEEEVEEPVPLVGRGREILAAATSAWQASAAGNTGMVVLRGAPGTGKTRLADEVAARARLDGAVVAEARALVGDGPSDVWTALLRGGLGVVELGGAAPQALAALVALEPDLAHRFPGSREHEPIPLADAVRLGLVAIAESRPVLLVLDDADRADPSVLEAVSTLVQRAAGVPICTLLTAAEQSAGIDRLSEHVGRDVKGTVQKTAPFDEAAVSELVRWAFPAYYREATDRLTRRVMVETAGNPFLAVEFVRAVRSGLRIGDEPGVPAVWPDAARTLDQTMPGDLSETVAAALRRRFRDLSESGQAMLCAVAAIGGTRSVEALARAAELSVAHAERALDELEWQRWLVGDARGYGFVTKLAREIVLGDMVTGGQRRRMRERAEAGWTADKATEERC